MDNSWPEYTEKITGSVEILSYSHVGSIILDIQSSSQDDSCRFEAKFGS